VKKGEPLFTIDPRPLKAALLQARASAAKDEAQLAEPADPMIARKIIRAGRSTHRTCTTTAKASFMSQQGLVAADNAAITNAALNLEFTTIISPIDGVVGAQLVYAGNIIKSEDDVMATITQIHPHPPCSFRAGTISRGDQAGDAQRAAARGGGGGRNIPGEPVEGQLTFHPCNIYWLVHAPLRIQLRDNLITSRKR